MAGLVTRFRSLGLLNKAVIYFCLVVEVGLVLAFGLLSLEQRSNVQSYAVVFDAGSVHTTVNVFEYPSNKYTRKDDPLGVLSGIWSCEISSNKSITDPSIGANIGSFLFVNRCLNDIVVHTPIIDEGVNTWFVVGATAGMRNLQREDPDRAQFLMSTLQNFMSKFPRTEKFPPQARVMSTKEEGKYGWLTVNYLLNGLNFEHPVGSLDLGGSSSELTFAAESNANAVIELANTTINIYTRSDECFGQAEALKRYFVTLIRDKYEVVGANGFHREPIDAPCQPSGAISNNLFVLKWDDIFSSECTQVADLEFKAFVLSLRKRTFEFVGRANATACYSTIQKLFNHRECKGTFSRNCFASSADSMPDMPNVFYAFSTYYFTGTMLNLDMSKSMLLGDTRAKTRTLCAQHLEDHPLTSQGEDHVQNECFRAAYMSTLLETGYGFNSSQQNVIQVVDKIQGQAVDWTMGFALAHTVNWPVEWIYVTPSCRFYVLTALVVFSICSFTYAYSVLVVNFDDIYRHF